MRALFALFLRSLREDVRAKSTYIVRAALVTLVLSFLWNTHDNSRWSGAVGLQFFRRILWIDFFVLSVVGLTYFASAITEEKENETLGLLRMTNLSALSILLGKSTGRMLGALFILGAQLPFMLVAVTMGGVATQQILAGFISLAGYSFFLANLGLLCSVVARRTPGATLFSAGAIVVLYILPLWIGNASLLTDTWNEKAVEVWMLLSPLTRIEAILETGFSGTLIDWQFVAALMEGVLCFVGAWLLFDRFADSTSEAPIFSRSQTSKADRKIRARAEMPALRWKDFRYIAGGRAAVAVKLGGTLVIAVLCLQTFRWGGPASEKVLAYGATLAFWNSLLLGVCVAIDASRIFKREREDRMLSSLLMLPFSTGRICREKMLGCLKVSGAPMIGVLIGLALIGVSLLPELPKSWSSVPGDVFAYGIPMAAHGLTMSLYLPVLIAWLSLRMRWGALPIGVTVWFFGNWILGFISLAAFREGSAVILPCISIVLLAITCKSIPRRLEALAAEE